MYKKTLIIIGIIFFFISIVSAATVEPLSNFNEIIPINESMVAGEGSCTLFDFTVNYNTTIVINFTIEHPEICSGEWCTTMLLNEEAFSNETAPGVFSTGEIEITKGDYALGVCYTSNSAIVPGDYNFSLEILSEDIVMASSSKSRGDGGSSTWPITTPIPTPAPNQTAVAGDSNVTPTPTPTPINITAEQIQEPSTSPWGMILAIILVLLVILLVRALIKRRKNKDNQP